MASTIKAFRKSLSTTVGTLSLAASAALLAQPAQAQAAVAKTIDIPAQSLASSLNQIGRQTSSEIIFLSSAVQGRRAPAVHGNFTAEQAIRIALEGTALAARQTPQGAYVIERAPSSGEVGAATLAAGQPASPEGGLDDIVVTAQKRSERLQDVPLAVTAVTGESLINANITDSKALSTVVPTLNFTQAASFAQPFIRGVGSRGNTPGDEQIVPIYVDGVYQIGMTAGFFKLNSIDRIEVLRGPQGTLFGRNAVGGAINILTRDPGFKPSAEIGIGYGRFKEIRGDLYASGPLTENLAANISMMRHQDDGYSHDVLRGTDEAKSHTTSIRAKLLWEPTEGLTAKVTGFFVKAADATGVAAFPLNGNTAARRTDPTVVLGRGYNLSNSFSPYAKTKTYGGSLDIDYQMGEVSISSLSSYAYFTSNFLTDNDGTASIVAGSTTKASFNGVDKHYTVTQELRATSGTGGPLKWLIGGFFFRDILHNPVFRFSPGLDVINRGTTRAFAVFGEAEYEIAPDFSAKAGLRYSTEKRTVNTFDKTLNRRLIDKRTFDDVSPRITLEYEIARNQRIYFTYSEAFKSGMIVEPITTASINFVNVVDPEKLRSFEIGVKGDVNSTFRANLAAYYYDYRNVQVTSQSLLPTGVSASSLQNAAKEEIYGIDADFTYAPTRDLTMGLALAWVHARYKDFTNASVQIPRPDGLGNMPAKQDVSGLHVQRAPDFAVGYNVSYTVPNEVFGGQLRLSGNALYNSGWYFDPNERVGTGDYVDLNARVAWTSPNERYTLAVWGSNLANSHRLQSVTESTGGDRVSLVRPISYGAEIRFKI